MFLDCFVKIACEDRPVANANIDSSPLSWVVLCPPIAIANLDASALSYVELRLFQQDFLQERLIFYMWYNENL